MKLLVQWPKPLRGGVKLSMDAATSQSPRDMTLDLNSAQPEQNNSLDGILFIFLSSYLLFPNYNNNDDVMMMSLMIM